MSEDAGRGDWASPGASAPPPGWSAQQPPPAPPPPGWAPPGWAGLPSAPQWSGPGSSPGWQPPWPPPPPAAPRPGIVPLRPLGVGEILDGAFAAVRRYPRPTLGLAAAVMLVVTAIQVVTEWALLSGITAPGPGATLTDATDYLGLAGSAAAVGGIVTQFAVLVLSGLITAVIGEAVLGRPITASQAWQRLRPVLWRLLGVSFLTGLAVAAVLAVGLLPGLLLVVTGASGAGAGLAVLGGLAGLVVAVWLYVSLSLAPAVVVLERQPVRVALRRSRLLVRRSWWRVFGILLLAVVIASVVASIIGLPFSVAGGLSTVFTRTAQTITFSALAITGVGRLVAATVVRPFNAGVIALLYIDRRMRAEALDLTLVRAASAPPAS